MVPPVPIIMPIVLAGAAGLSPRRVGNNYCAYYCAYCAYYAYYYAYYAYYAYYNNVMTRHNNA